MTKSYILNGDKMQPQKNVQQTDPIEQTMRKVVWGFIAISTVISLIYLWFDHSQLEKQVDENKATINQEAAATSGSPNDTPTGE